MEKRKNILMFVILFTTLFAGYVSIKYFDRNKLVNLNSKFSIEEGQLVKVANKDYTNIKLLSITRIKCRENCSNNYILRYKLLINGNQYYIDNIPTTIELYDDGEAQIVDGDEDRLVLKVVEVD